MPNNESTDLAICSRASAKKAFEQDNFILAAKYYHELWKDSPSNPYLLSRLGQSMRKTNKCKEFIQICRSLTMSTENNSPLRDQYVLNVLCWCLYDCHIKNYHVKDKENFDQFLKSALFIRKNSHQKEADEFYYNPYVLTICMVVKIYSEKASVNYRAIIEWLNFLNPEKLSEEPFTFVDEDGQDRELASRIEFYYQRYTKALEKTEQYSECIDKAETALSTIEKFHYRNDIWIKSRLYFSRCMVQEDFENALKDYEILAKREKHWFMFHKLSQVYYRFNLLEKSLLFACKAFNLRFEGDKMINLMLDLGFLLETVGKTDDANAFFQASAYYRAYRHWRIPEELQYRVELNALDVSLKPDINALKKITYKYVSDILSTERSKGTINNLISPHKKAGFIRPKSGGKNIYFNARDVQGPTKVGANVTYELSQDRQNRSIAVNILVEES